MVVDVFNEVRRGMGVIDALDPGPELSVLVVQVSDFDVSNFKVSSGICCVVSVLGLRNRKNTRTNAREQSSTDKTPEKVITAVRKLACIFFHGASP